MRQIQGATNIAQTALAALGMGASVGGLAMLVKGAIDAADNLRDMSQKTGIAVESLSGLGFAAGQAGGSLETMVGAAGKLNKAISEAAGGNKDTSAAFAALGVDVLDASGNLKKADVVMAELADQFAKYQDGPEKAAIALKLFGKSGADMIPLLNDGGDAMRENIAYAKKYSNSTTELSNASDNFNDTMGKLALQQKGFANAMASAVLPILQKVADETLGAAEQSDKFALASNIVRTVLETFVVVGSEVAYMFKAAGTEIGGLAAQLAALAHADFKGFNAISTAMKEDAELARKEHDKFIADILDRTPPVIAPHFSDSAFDAKDKPKPNAPRLASSARDTTDDPAKKQFEGRLKALESALAKEQSELEFGNKYVAILREQDQINLEMYNDYRKKSLESGLSIAIKSYDAEIAEAERYQAATNKLTEKASAQNKIDELRAKKSKAIQDSANDGKLLTLDLSKAQSELNKTMIDWSRQQDINAGQMKFEIDLHGKSALEIEKLTNARRIELDIEEKIRAAKEKGAITDESIAAYRKAGAAQSATVNKISTQARGDQIGRDQRTPGEVENERHANEIKDLQAYQDVKFENIASGNLRIEEENRRHANAMTSMQLSTAQNMLGLAQSSAGELYDALKSAGMEQTALGKAMFFAQKAIQVATIIVNTEVAAAAAEAGMIAAAAATAAVSGPAGPAIIAAGAASGAAYAAMTRAMGYATAGLVAGTAIASAEGGYDIPAGKNPMTQLHEKEMVLPKAQADVIRGLATRGGNGGSGDFKLTLISNGTQQRVVESRRIAPDEWALIVEDAKKATIADLYQPNSKGSKAMHDNFGVQRRRL